MSGPRACVPIKKHYAQRARILLPSRVIRARARIPFTRGIYNAAEDDGEANKKPFAQAETRGKAAPNVIALADVIVLSRKNPPRGLIRRSPLVT